ncbi:MAG: ABC transporter ATP-binding protein [Methylococcaceae bacterium]|nr:ABC transporter ATP-binding protein [Methylococcaceae bacterium]
MTFTKADDSALELKSVSFFYEKNVGVKNLNLRLPHRNVYGFLGRNGAGKSTTLQILCGVLRPHQGRVLFNGDESPIVKTEWKQAIGYVPQNPAFPQQVSAVQTAWLLSRLYPKWQDDRFKEMSSAFQLPLNRKIETYSFGMKTMLSVSLAYACDPEIYILDEPTSGLDPISRRLVLGLIRQEKAKGKSIIFSTHIVDDLYENCDYLGIIDQGELLKEGPLIEFGDSTESLEERYFQLIKYRQAEDVAA